MSWRVKWLRFTLSVCLGGLLMAAGQHVCAEQGESMPRRALAPVRVNPVLLHPQERRISLAGEWNFRLDPRDQGVKEQWFDDRGTLTDKIKVPGCWQGQGFGGDGKDQLFEDRGRHGLFGRLTRARAGMANIFTLLRSGNGIVSG